MIRKVILMGNFFKFFEKYWIFLVIFFFSLLDLYKLGCYYWFVSVKKIIYWFSVICKRRIIGFFLLGDFGVSEEGGVNGDI